MTNQDQPQNLEQEPVTESESTSDNKDHPQTIAGKHVEIHQGGAHMVQGERVDLIQGDARYIKANVANIERSGTVSVQAKQVALQQSAAGLINGDEIHLSEDSSAGVIVAQRVNGQEISTQLLLAGEVYGNVKTTLDTVGALLLGIGTGIGLGLVFAIKDLVLNREK